MTERSQAADLATRLAEFDRKLRAIQADLAPDRVPAPVRPGRTTGRSGPLEELLQHAPVPTTPERRRRPLAPDQPQLEELRALFSSLHELLNGIEAVVARIAQGGREATIAAGPFTTIRAVRQFEQELAAVPGVREVSVRGYEGAARVIIDVQLGEEG
jgi:hypothetical protein